MGAPLRNGVGGGSAIEDDRQGRLRRDAGADGPGRGPTGVTLAMRTTKPTQAETALRLENAAFHAAADAIVITDRAGTIERVNPAFTTLTGYTAAEALGQNSWDLVKSGKHPPGFFDDVWQTIVAG